MAGTRTVQVNSEIVELLKACAKDKDLQRGTRLHAYVVKQGLFIHDSYIASSLVNMYAKCDALAKAAEVLEGLPIRDVVSFSALVTGYAHQGLGEEALKCFEMMLSEGVSPDRITFISALKACGCIRAAVKGKQIHEEILERGLLGQDTVLGTALVDMYAKCGVLTKAAQVFDELPIHNVASWNAVIAVYAQEGRYEEALACFELIQHEGLAPNSVTFICLLNSCTSMEALGMGELVHNEIADCGLLGNDIVLDTTLVDMYVKCGALAKAAEVLDSVPVKSVVSWNTLIEGYSRQGQVEDALKCFEQMQAEGLFPNSITMTCILKVCGNIVAADKGKQIHVQMLRQDLMRKDPLLGITLVDMYAKCGLQAKVAQVLKRLPVRTAVSYNTLIPVYAQRGLAEEALELFNQMQMEGLSPNTMTIICILNICGNINAHFKIKPIHDEIRRRGLLLKDIVTGTALVDAYVKCGALAEARHVLDELPVRDTISWNVLIAGHVHQDQCERAFKYLEQMQLEGLFPDTVTFIFILKACGSLGAHVKGKQIHHEILRRELLGKNSMLDTSLVDMHVKCSALSEAEEVLLELSACDIASWNALIVGYCQHGHGDGALKCFGRMQGKGITPDAVTFTCLLKAFGSIGSADKGEQIHAKVAQQGLLEKDIVIGNALVDMYARCGALSKAAEVLEKLPVRDVVSWSALISGYVHQEQGEEALKCFELMQIEGLSPNIVTFVCILKACGSIGAAAKGEQVHEEILRLGYLGKDIVLDTTLVDMYAKCGEVVKALQVLDKLAVRNVATWNALIAGYAQNGQGKEALVCLEWMYCEGLYPDMITLACVLNACSRSSLLNEGEAHFSDISRKHGIKPDAEHLTSMADLFGRAGEFDKAVTVIKKMPFDDLPVWLALLGRCKESTNVKVGILAFKNAVQKDVDDAAAYELMANIYAAAGIEEDVSNTMLQETPH